MPDLAAIRKRYEAARLGPWISATRASPAPHIVSVDALRADDMSEPVCELRPGLETTGDFIAHARIDLPAVVEALEEARMLLKEIVNAKPVRLQAAMFAALQYLGESE